MMDTQLNRQCLEVLHAKTVKEFVRISAEFGQSMGFHTMASMVVTDHGPNFSEFQSVTDAPIDYLPTFEDANSARLDALRRSIDGLSNWEVGQAMGISETEVLLRLRRATTKLGCATKYEAALRAIKLGLVDCG